MTARNALTQASHTRRRIGAGLIGAMAALGALLGSPATAQQPWLNTPPPAAPDIRPGEACSLVLVQSFGARVLVARAAPGIAGSWSLTVRNAGLEVDQSGPVTGARHVQELSRITLDGQRPPAINHGAAGLYGPVSYPGQSPVNATLVVRNERGRVICRARPDLR
mgnify:CR=1 FL=1